MLTLVAAFFFIICASASFFEQSLGLNVCSLGCLHYRWGGPRGLLISFDCRWLLAIPTCLILILTVPKSDISASVWLQSTLLMPELAFLFIDHGLKDLLHGAPIIFWYFTCLCFSGFSACWIFHVSASMSCNLALFFSSGYLCIDGFTCIIFCARVWFSPRVEVWLCLY